uniref:2c protein n=1 Tax=Tobacco rattle virus TaxID=12295 RepID=A0A0U3U523_9VIRU|nr:2c protein [Tobacco rattle virus]
MTTFTSYSVPIDEGVAEFHFQFSNYSYWGAFYKNGIEGVDGMHDAWNNDYFQDHAPSSGLYLTLYCSNPGGSCSVYSSVHYNGTEVTKHFTISIDGTEYNPESYNVKLFQTAGPGKSVHVVKVFAKYIDLSVVDIGVTGVNSEAIKLLADALPNILSDEETEKFYSKLVATPTSWESYMLGSEPLMLKKKGLAEMLVPLFADATIASPGLLVFGAGFVAVGLLWLYYLAFPESGRERRDSSTVSAREMRFKEAMTNCLASSTNFGIPVSSGRFHAWKGPKTFEAFERLKTKKSYPSESFHPFFNANGWLDIGFGTRMF